MYGDDNAGQWILYYYRVSGTGRSWASFLLGYKNTSDWKEDSNAYLTNPNSVICPTEVPFTMTRDTYAYNRVYGASALAANKLPTPYDTNNFRIKASNSWILLPGKMTAPAAWMVLADSLCEVAAPMQQSWAIFGDAVPSGANGTIHTRHANRANVLFSDGHAGGCAKEDETFRISGIKYCYGPNKTPLATGN